MIKRNRNRRDAPTPPAGKGTKSPFRSVMQRGEKTSHICGRIIFPPGFSWGSEEKVWGPVGSQEEAACLISSSLNNKGPSLPPSFSLLKFKFTFFQMGSTFSGLGNGNNSAKARQGGSAIPRPCFTLRTPASSPGWSTSPMTLRRYCWNVYVTPSPTKLLLQSQYSTSLGLGPLAGA